MSDTARDAELIELCRAWSRAANGTAVRRDARADQYGAQLATARSQVYAAAARLIEEFGAAAAAAVMTERAGLSAVLTPPLARFDPAGLRYIRARAWQHVAQYIDPDQPTVQKPWD